MSRDTPIPIEKGSPVPGLFAAEYREDHIGRERLDVPEPDLRNIASRHI